MGVVQDSLLGAYLLSRLTRCSTRPHGRVAAASLPEAATPPPQHCCGPAWPGRAARCSAWCSPSGSTPGSAAETTQWWCGAAAGSRSRPGRAGHRRGGVTTERARRGPDATVRFLSDVQRCAAVWLPSAASPWAWGTASPRGRRAGGARRDRPGAGQHRRRRRRQDDRAARVAGCCCCAAGGAAVEGASPDNALLGAKSRAPRAASSTARSWGAARTGQRARIRQARRRVAPSPPTRAATAPPTAAASWPTRTPSACCPPSTSSAPWGREGLVDTAVKTVTGYLQRRRSRPARASAWRSTGACATATARVVEFEYGGDGIAPERLQHVPLHEARAPTTSWAPCPGPSCAACRRATRCAASGPRPAGRWRRRARALGCPWTRAAGDRGRSGGPAAPGDGPARGGPGRRRGRGGLARRLTSELACAELELSVRYHLRHASVVDVGLTPTRSPPSCTAAASASGVSSWRRARWWAASPPRASRALHADDPQHLPPPGSPP